MIAKTNRSIDIEFVIRPISGSAKSNTGMLDRSLFTGGNTLHAKMDTQTCLWYLEYEMGGLPMPLRQKYTGYAPLLKHVTEYLKSRNAHITEVKD